MGLGAVGVVVDGLRYLASLAGVGGAESSSRRERVGVDGFRDSVVIGVAGDSTRDVGSWYSDGCDEQGDEGSPNGRV